MVPREIRSGSEAAVGRRTMRATGGAIVLASLLALGVCASAASAEPLSMTFTEARANVGVQLSDEALFEAPATAPLEAEIDPETGEIADGVLQVPAFETHIDEPTVADVTVEFEIGIVTGSFDQATGALILSGQAGGILTTEDGRGPCAVSAGNLTLSTAGNSGGDNPRVGAPFTAGLTGAGAIAGQWDDMTATEIDPEDAGFCENVYEEIGGDGGVWLEHEGDLVPPAAPQLVSTDPASPSLSGTPRILGAAEAGSTVRVFAGLTCTGTPVATGGAAELGSPGIPVQVAEGVTAAFSATATDAAGNTSACSAPISYGRLNAPPSPAPPPEPAPEINFSLGVESKSLRGLLRSGSLVVTARVDRAADVALTGRARLKVRAQGKARTRLVSVFKRKTVRFTEAGKKKVKLTLTRKGRRTLRRLRSVRLSIAGKATTAAGETATRRVALTLPRHRVVVRYRHEGGIGGPRPSLVVSTDRRATVTFGRCRARLALRPRAWSRLGAALRAADLRAIAGDYSARGVPDALTYVVKAGRYTVRIAPGARPEYEAVMRDLKPLLEVLDKTVSAGKRRMPASCGSN
jgi:hypothetical protein